jgi:hypothetical protein
MVTASLLPVGLVTGHSFAPKGPEATAGQVSGASEPAAAS